MRLDMEQPVGTPWNDPRTRPDTGWWIGFELVPVGFGNEKTAN